MQKVEVMAVNVAKHAGSNLFQPRAGSELRPSRDTGPLLLLSIDVEEDFDWSKPFRRDGYGLASVEAIPEMVHFVNQYGVLPTLLIDYPVLSDPTAAGILRPLYRNKSAIMGTQLHAWVTPPFEEDLSVPNSFAGNLPLELERAKLANLNKVFTQVFGDAPKVFRSGRYGFGPNSARLLLEHGYDIDLSHFAGRDFSFDGGPCYRNIRNSPFIEASDAQVFCIPLTTGYFGPFRNWGGEFLRVSEQKMARSLHVRGALEALGVIGWTWLSPEGVRLRSAKALTRSLIEAGQDIFVVSFHSPSLKPGNTQYVRTDSQQKALFQWLDSYIRFFMDELGGRATTPQEVKELWG